jgi:hypothetical protein
MLQGKEEFFTWPRRRTEKLITGRTPAGMASKGPGNVYEDSDNDNIFHIGRKEVTAKRSENDGGLRREK